VAALAWPLAALASTPDAAPFRLPRQTDSFFIEDALVYKRLLHFERNGVYHEIDQDRWTSAETDRGTWEQDSHGAVLLHPTTRALRFRALFAGPLTVVLDRPEALPALPLLRDAIHAFLARSEDAVFARSGVDEMRVRPPGSGESIGLLSIDPHVETFARAELESLQSQLNDLLWSMATNTSILEPVRLGNCDLLVLRGAVYQPPELARLRRERHLPAGQPPPFCFARVNAPAFVRAAGTYRPFHPAGSPD